jgi:hypothetical protein
LALISGILENRPVVIKEQMHFYFGNFLDLRVLCDFFSGYMIQEKKIVLEVLWILKYFHKHYTVYNQDILLPKLEHLFISVST